MISPATRAGRFRLRLRYALRRHEMTGKRVRGLRWRREVGPTGMITWHLGSWDAEKNIGIGWNWLPTRPR